MNRLHACHNRAPFRDRYLGLNGYCMTPATPHGTLQIKTVEIPHVMTRDCQYTKQNPNDQRCEGCKHKSETP